MGCIILSDGHCTDFPLLHCGIGLELILVCLCAKGPAFWKGGIHGNGRKGMDSEAQWL